jgi:hypothetical protein
MGLNGLPNTVKKREISEKQLISASHFFLPHLSASVQQKLLQRTAEAMGAEN